MRCGDDEEAPLIPGGGGAGVNRVSRPNRVADFDGNDPGWLQLAQRSPPSRFLRTASQHHTTGYAC